MKTLSNSSLITLVVVASALFVAAPVAYADSETVNGTIAPALANFPPPTTAGTVSQFDPSLGTLTSVQITLSGSGTTDIAVTATSGSPTVFTVLSTDLGLTLTDPIDADVSTLESMSGGPTIPGGGLTVVNGTPYNSGLDTMGGTPGSQTLSSNLSSFRSEEHTSELQ